MDYLNLFDFDKILYKLYKYIKIYIFKYIPLIITLGIMTCLYIAFFVSDNKYEKLQLLGYIFFNFIIFMCFVLFILAIELFGKGIIKVHNLIKKANKKNTVMKTLKIIGHIFIIIFLFLYFFQVNYLNLIILILII